MNDDPLASIGAEIGQAVRTTTAAVMHGVTAAAYRSEQRARRRRVELVEHRKALEHAANAARLAAGPDDNARRWLAAIAKGGGEDRAIDTWQSGAWNSLAAKLTTYEAEGKNVVDTLPKVVARRGFSDRLDSAAIIEYRIDRHFQREQFRADAAETERQSTGPDADAQRWLDAITEVGGEKLAADVWKSGAWNALANTLSQYESESRDVVGALLQVVPQRDFDDRRDSAAIIEWRVKQHFGDRSGAGAVEKADATSLDGAEWRWTSDDMYVVKPRAKSQQPSKKSQSGQYRPRSYDPNRAPDVER